MDLHSKNTYLAVMDHKFKRVFEKRVNNELSLIEATLNPFKQELEGIVVESTYNWYWLLDGLIDAGYKDFHLANPCGIQQYKGLKYTDDSHDAFWLAHLLILGILPEGYIYPKEERPIRDLLRKRSFLVHQRTNHVNSLSTMIERHTSKRPDARETMKLETSDLEKIFEEKHLVLAAQASAASISVLNHHVKQIQKTLKNTVKLRKPFDLLKTVPGIGDVLALTIMLEVGDINRFPTVGRFASYARCVPTARLSNGKSKGKGNRKNGNRYLSWAFVEAAFCTRRLETRLKAYYQKKAAKTNKIVATKALCNKLARISYYIMRDEIPFREEALYG
jgi:transposase